MRIRLALFLVFCSIQHVFACGSGSQWLCEIGHGLTMAESAGKNGILLSGYAYHTTIAAHWPSGVSDQKPTDPTGLNEIPYGAGYSRSWYNHDTHEEYTLFAIVFSDSYWKPEAHIGYTYQKFHPIFDSNNLEWGMGYTPMLLIKPSWTNDAPIILPGAGITSTLRYKDLEIMGTWANVIFVNLKLNL